MKSDTTQANLTRFTDFQGLTDLRRSAKEDPRAALKTVARQFEAIFMDMLLKSMREAELGDGIFDSNQSDFYSGMLDHEMAINLSEQGTLGLAAMMVRQLEGTLPGGRAATEAAERQEFAVPERPAESSKKGRAESSVKANESKPDPVRFESPEEFVRHLWPSARKAAGELGVAPEALLAQAALETGWGRSIIRRADGSSSNNLFNIKAGSRWDGERVGKTTLEYREGVAVKEFAQFRAYRTHDESFADYVGFLRDNPRYREALEKAGDPLSFIGALQDAGYATDPAYARKIHSIMNELGKRRAQDILVAAAK